MFDTTLDTAIMEFVASLNGRYKEYVSDAFLTALLTAECNKKQSYIGEEVEQNDLYEVGQYVFEILLEVNCKALGNGHHVAQNFALFVEAKTKQTE